MTRAIICCCHPKPMKPDRKYTHRSNLNCLAYSRQRVTDRYTLPPKREIIDIETCESIVLCYSETHIADIGPLGRHPTTLAAASYQEDCHVCSLRFCNITTLMTLRVRGYVTKGYPGKIACCFCIAYLEFSITMSLLLHIFH